MGYFIDSSKPVESRLRCPCPAWAARELSTHAAILHLPAQARQQGHGPSSSRGPREPKAKKKLFTLLDLCVSSLRRGHANLLCIVPNLTDAPPKWGPIEVEIFYLYE